MKYSPQILAQKIVQSGMSPQNHIRGLTDDEIAEIENSFKLSFPGSYKEFLRTMGGSSDKVFYSVNFVFPGLAEQMSCPYELLAAANLQLPPSAFVFLIEDARFLFFDANEGEDPPVYEFIEARGIVKIADTFSLWLSDYVMKEIELDLYNQKSSTFPRPSI